MSLFSELPKHYIIQLAYQGAYDLFTKGVYRNSEWQDNYRDRPHGEIQLGDFIIPYFTNRSPLYKQAISQIYKVIKTADSKKTIKLKKIYDLEPLSYEEINNLVLKEALSINMKRCGVQGLNIIEIKKSDYLYLLNRKTNVLRDESKILNRKENYEKFEEESDKKLLMYYKGDFDLASSSVIKKLRGAGYIKTKSINGNKKIVLTEIGQEAISAQ
ncbi:MAG: DUF6293 family protein [Candidatus Hodarchaeales archaeon]